MPLFAHPHFSDPILSAMKNNHRHVAIFALFISCSLLSPAFPIAPAVAGAQQVEITPTTFRVGDHLIHGDRGRLFVRENRQQADSRNIEIAFFRLRQEESSKAPPIVYLPGGPGQPVLENAKDFAATYKNYLNLGGQSDMLVVEQRGIGASRPRLDCPGQLSRPEDKPLSAEIMGSTHQHYFERCMDHWIGQGVDPGGYDVLNMADDIDELRESLGYEQIKVFGESFGSHHALALIARHGEHIERAVLSAVIGPDDMFELPAEIDSQFSKVGQSATGDGRWDGKASMASLFTRLENPIRVPSERGDHAMQIGRYDLALATVTLAQQTAFLDQLPMLYQRIADGNLSWLANWSLKMRSGHAPNLASLLISCASGASKERRAEITRQAADSLLGDAIDLLGADTCTPVADLELDNGFRKPVSADMPVLLISGELDPRAPPANAEAILPGLRHGHHVVFPGVSHDFGKARNAQLELVYRFLARGETEPNPALMPKRP